MRKQLRRAICHPDRPYLAKGLCRACYEKLPSRKRTKPNYPENGYRWHLKYKYGITPQDYDRMFLEQEGRCAICRKPPFELKTKGTKRLHIDHDHRCCPGDVSCGKCIRGLLCFGCNRLLAAVETPAWVEAARDYVQNPPVKTYVKIPVKISDLERRFLWAVNEYPPEKWEV